MTRRLDREDRLVHPLPPRPSIRQHALDQPQRNLPLTRAARHDDLLDPARGDLLDVVPRQPVEASKRLCLPLEG
ncbi:MAG TPA: hypothetical protein VN746_14785 [Gaiella sp.]|nr:hypothetical protein [Gaiella sp.]